MFTIHLLFNSFIIYFLFLDFFVMKNDSDQWIRVHVLIVAGIFFKV